MIKQIFSCSFKQKLGKQMHLITIFCLKKEVKMDLQKSIMEMELLSSTDHQYHHSLRRHSLRHHNLSIHLQRVCHQLHQVMKQLSQHRFQLCQSLFYNFPQHRITRLRLTKSHQQHLLRQRLHILLSVSMPLNLCFYLKDLLLGLLIRLPKELRASFIFIYYYLFLI